jgi:hypothetical protein
MSLFHDDRTGALFSPCRTWRYRLWRAWNLEKPRLVFVMLNPSTADETKPDATITRCMLRAKNMGYGGLEVVNIFALRSTDPDALYNAADPVGPENDKHILAVCDTAIGRGGQIILGWGKHGAFRKRGDVVRRMLDDNQLDSYALVINKDGSPKHPLYIAMDKEPICVSPWAEKETA